MKGNQPMPDYNERAADLLASHRMGCDLTARQEAAARKMDERERQLAESAVVSCDKIIVTCPHCERDHWFRRDRWPSDNMQCQFCEAWFTVPNRALEVLEDLEGVADALDRHNCWPGTPRDRER